LTFWPLSEAFIRSWYSILLDLDTMTSRRVKKAVVRMAELIAALVPIHGLFTFLMDVNGLLDPPGCVIWIYLATLNSELYCWFMAQMILSAENAIKIVISRCISQVPTVKIQRLFKYYQGPPAFKYFQTSDSRLLPQDKPGTLLPDSIKN